MVLFRTKATAAAIAALVAFSVMSGVSLAQSGRRTIVVRQEKGGSMWQFGTASLDHKEQMIAQTFVSPGPDLKLVAIAPGAIAPGRSVVVDVYKVGAEPPTGDLLSTVEYVGDPWESGAVPWHRVAIKPGLSLEAGATYSFVLSLKDSNASAGSSASGSSKYEEGDAYCYCPVADEEGLPTGVRAWQPSSTISWGPTDLGFRLYFRKPKTA